MRRSAHRCQLILAAGLASCVTAAEGVDGTQCVCALETICIGVVESGGEPLVGGGGEREMIGIVQGAPPAVVDAQPAAWGEDGGGEDGGV